MVREYHFSYYEIYEEDIQDNEVYLNANGMLISDCNLSYETQDECKTVQLGHIEETNILEACQKWNKKLDEIGSTDLYPVIEHELETV